MSQDLASIVAAMRGYLAAGIHETPSGPNGSTEIGRRYGWDKVAWCAMTVSMAQFDAGGKFVFKTAGVAQARDWAKANKSGLRWIPKANAKEVRAGHFATFDWKGNNRPDDMHISCVIDPGTLVTDGRAGKFETIGGNEGDRVQKQWRDCRFVMGWIALPWPATDGGDDMPISKDDLKEIAKIVDHEVNEAVRFLIEPNGGALQMPAQGFAKRLDAMGNVIDEINERLRRLEERIK